MNVAEVRPGDPVRIAVFACNGYEASVFYRPCAGVRLRIEVESIWRDAMPKLGEEWQCQDEWAEELRAATSKSGILYWDGSWVDAVAREARMAPAGSYRFEATFEYGPDARNLTLRSAPVGFDADWQPPVDTCPEFDALALTVNAVENGRPVRIDVTACNGGDSIVGYLPRYRTCYASWHLLVLVNGTFQGTWYPGGLPPNAGQCWAPTSLRLRPGESVQANLNWDGLWYDGGPMHVLQPLDPGHHRVAVVFPDFSRGGRVEADVYLSAG